MDDVDGEAAVDTYLDRIGALADNCLASRFEHRAGQFEVGLGLRDIQRKYCFVFHYLSHGQYQHCNGHVYHDLY